MDITKANVIRKVIRILSCVSAAVAAVLAYVFRKIERITDLEAVSRMSTMGRVARICARATFVFAVGILLFDLATKTFPAKSSAIGAVIALVGFIGNFIIAVASTSSGFLMYIMEHANLSGKVTMTQLNIGSYMILASGVFLISYNAKCMKSGT